MLQKGNSFREPTTLTPALISEVLQAIKEQKKIILIVDDDEAIRETLVECIQEGGFPYHLIATGYPLEALQVADMVTPVLFLLDYRLPEMSGIELYDRLHQKGELECVPTLLMSANLPYQEVSKRKIVTIKKPFDFNRLLDTIEALLTPVNV